jgi:predicted RNase H-like HicB family nuclease
MSTRYLIVVEGDESTNYSAYSPDLPGVVATGATVEECVREMEAAVAFHLDGLREEGSPIPPPVSQAAYVEVEPPAA